MSTMHNPTFADYFGTNDGNSISIGVQKHLQWETACFGLGEKGVRISMTLGV